MFQNITYEVEQEDVEDVELKNESQSKKVLLKIFTKQNIFLYVVSFLLSISSLGGVVAPFGIAMFAAICSNNIAVGISYILMVIGTIIGFGVNEGLVFLLTSLVFVGMILIFKPSVIEENDNEKRKLGLFLIVSISLVQCGKLFLNTFLVYDLLVSIITVISAFVFYKIFSNSLNLVTEYGIKLAFSIEEVIGFSLMLAVAVSAIKGFTIFGLCISNIVCILIVLVLGWKNGILVGATSGITIGTVLGIIGIGQPAIIATYAVSGMIAGVFSKLGKFGVIIGFIIGNILITYITNGNTVQIIYMKEILVASLGLLLIPKRIGINISDLMSKDLYLPVTSSYKLEENEDAVYKLNSASEAIKEMSNTYKSVIEEIIEETDYKKIFIDDVNNELVGHEENILYDDMIDDELGILADAFNLLEKQKIIIKEDLIKIFENHNSYIVGFNDYEVSLQIERDISDVVKILNDVYKRLKQEFVTKKKIEENKRNFATQLEGVSKAISSLADEMKEVDDFLKEEKEIIKICKQKNIMIKDIKIKQEKNKKYIANVYIEENIDETVELEEIEKILSRVLKEEVVFQNERTILNQEGVVYVQTYAPEDNFNVQIGIAKIKKDGSSISGDTNLCVKLNDGKYLIAISDGMGSGPNARKTSQIAIKSLERLLENGFDKETSIEMINGVINLNAIDDIYATLDIAIFDLYKGNIEFVKNGACPTFIKNEKEVQILKNLTLPAGLLNETELIVYDRDMDDNDILVMCTDGIIESNQEYDKKELWIKELLEKIKTDNVQKIADLILKESVDNNYGLPKDDMTVIAVKIKKKENLNN